MQQFESILRSVSIFLFFKYFLSFKYSIVKKKKYIFTEKDVSKVNAIVHGIVMDIPIPFPLPNADACQTPDSGITCPLNKGETYHYKNTLPVHKSYPKVLSTIIY